MSDDIPELAGQIWLCETVGAGPRTPMHLRRLTGEGAKEGGGADTPSLCGRAVAWDVRRAYVSDTLNRRHTCGGCIDQSYADANAGQLGPAAQALREAQYLDIATRAGRFTS